MRRILASSWFRGMAIVLITTIMVMEVFLDAGHSIAFALCGTGVFWAVGLVTVRLRCGRLL